ncbi:type I-F CRISPR-associated protein Csy2 [Gilvimarinus algae]|uniref:Type I-F CRISPR-associated protein Csy2 n=1 Tax=Gilvimarinus algae TaxID=3058037 RepID=A0ABT8TIY1_9GAMM|nr:type I-F CRISPR-associated protein Csy2 [Gilvimarinus sp. SDUM040014]MDO3383303.1 type I-F CRISPR-associated protein Csy2 [Gilvimarinus sp. SDUM040014]
MSECPGFDYLLVVPHLRVQNANAISSPLTHGFPAMSAFVGLMWALERKAKAAGLDLDFNAVGVVSHGCEEQVASDGFVSGFHLTRNPVGKDGKTAAIAEEGRVHLDISLVFAVGCELIADDTEQKAVADKVKALIESMRIAGGSVVPSLQPPWRTQPYMAGFAAGAKGREETFDQLKMRLLPGFVLTDRQDALNNEYEALRELDNKATRLDALLSLSRIDYVWQPEKDNADKGEWIATRASGKNRSGWLVPMPIGYGALTELQDAGSVENARDNTTPFCFVESLFSIGEWLSPHRLQKPEQLLWYANTCSDTGAYRVCNDYRPSEILETIND